MNMKRVILVALNEYQYGGRQFSIVFCSLSNMPSSFFIELLHRSFIALRAAAKINARQDHKIPYDPLIETMKFACIATMLKAILPFIFFSTL